MLEPSRRLLGLCQPGKARSSACDRSAIRSADVLDADGQAHRAPVDERGGALRGGILLAAEQSRGQHQRFGRARDSHAMEKYSSASAKRLPSPSPPFSSKLTTVPKSSSGAWPIRAADGTEARIEDALHARMAREKAAHRHGIGALPLVAQEIGAHPALNQERGMRVERRAERDDVLAHPLISSRRAMIAPPITSPCPEAYLVRLCRKMSMSKRPWL